MTELEEAMLVRAGIPLLRQAFKEAERFSRSYFVGKPKKWSCDVVFHAAYQAGFLRQKDLNQEQLAELFQDKFYEACQIFVRGGTLHKRPVYQNKPTPVAIAAMADLKAKFQKNAPAISDSPPLTWSKNKSIRNAWDCDAGYRLLFFRTPEKRYEILRPGEFKPFAHTSDRDEVPLLIAADLHARAVSP